uniref:Uncharacterized protein n=1 Tax=Strix occidentalis caurina TaxID=311401 RepID=A0A8D0FRR5_STROC
MNFFFCPSPISLGAGVGNIRKDFSRHPGEQLVTWLLRCWDSGASGMELEGREARQLGSLCREGGIDKAIGRRTQNLSLWRRLLSSMRERYPFKEDFACRPSKRTTMERGIQHLRELAVWEAVYYDPDNARLPTDPDEVRCTRPMWRTFVRSTPSSYASGPTVNELARRLRQYEESVSSPIIAAVKKLSQDFQQFKENMSYSPPARTRISAIRSNRFSTRENRMQATVCFHLEGCPTHLESAAPGVETQPHHLPWTDPCCTGTR